MTLGLLITLGVVRFTMVFFFPIGIGSVPSGNLQVFSHFDFELSLDLSDLLFQ